MGANGSHQVDLIRWWCGEIKSVFGQALTIVKDRIENEKEEIEKEIKVKLTEEQLKYLKLGYGKQVSIPKNLYDDLYDDLVDHQEPF